MELIAADTDLLVMLIYIWNNIIGEITINSEATKNYKAIKCDIVNTAERISNVRKYLNLVHAFDECNTTSAAYEQDKLSVLELLVARDEAHVIRTFGCKGRGPCILAERQNSKDNLGNRGNNICCVLLWKRFRFIDRSEIFKTYGNGFIFKNYKTLKFTSNFKSRTH